MQSKSLHGYTQHIGNDADPVHFGFAVLMLNIHNLQAVISYILGSTAR